MFRTFLSLRYLRVRKTTWIGMAGISIAVAALILILSIMSGFLAEGRRHLRGNLADIAITPIDRPIRHGARPSRDLERMLALIEEDPRIVAATPQLVWYGLLAPDQFSRALEQPMQEVITLVEMVGIDPEREVRVTEFGESLRREPSQIFSLLGRPPDPDDPFALPDNYRPSGKLKPPMIVGEQLGAVWQLRKGEEVPLLTVTYDDRRDEVNEEPSKLSFVVVGSFRSGGTEMDLQRVYMDRRDLADFLGRNEGPEPRDFSSVLVKLRDYERDKEAVRKDLYERLGAAGYVHGPELREITTWEDQRQQLLKAIKNERILLGVILIPVLLVACFTIFALLSNMVSEKRRDIGILCALGATPRGVMQLFLLIGMWQALIGCVVGASVGVWAALHIDDIEQALSTLFGVQIFDRSVYFLDHIPTVLQPVVVAIIVSAAILLSLLFALVPAWRASRLNPVDALRYE